MNCTVGSLKLLRLFVGYWRGSIIFQNKCTVAVLEFFFHIPTAGAFPEMPELRNFQWYSHLAIIGFWYSLLSFLTLSFRWICIYPAYLNSAKTRAEGRLLAKDKCLPNPSILEIRDVLVKMLKCKTEFCMSCHYASRYLRQWFSTFGSWRAVVSSRYQTVTLEFFWTWYRSFYAVPQPK